MISGVKNANIELNLVDKLIHGVLFGILSLLMVIGFTKQNQFKNLKFYAEKHTFIVCFCFGILIEIIQYLLPYRTFSWLDVLANTCGTILGLGLFYMIYKFRAT